MQLIMGDDENVMNLSNEELATVIVGLKTVVKLTGDATAVVMVETFNQKMKELKK